jgi:hypothetical protein
MIEAHSQSEQHELTIAALEDELKINRNAIEEKDRIIEGLAQQHQIISEQGMSELAARESALEQQISILQ